ncbi:aminoglycoside phosphotransferase family protein [Roseococcus sp. YIM B11640]|uniref:aminoglycoside phosphotransferase family protein n=1 Tax=Roseococcus sp. YIM B11640 TaxID=3133973 RepID=UPI003C7BE44C
MFEPYLGRWGLVPDGPPIETHAAHLLPVRQGPVPAMLKLSAHEEEQRGGAVLEWWNGDGAATVLARDEGALLMERATGPRSLSEMARAGEDDEASRILCAAAARLHVPRGAPPAGVVPLATWFRDLEPFAASHGGILARSLGEARQLLAAPREVAVLHGDLHHDNVLDFGARGWLAIDPKALAGERGFDHANIFTNPDLADPTRPVATLPGRFARRLEVVCEAAGLERGRLLRWILAWAGLSAAWYLGDGDPATTDLAIAGLAAAELDG